MIYRSVIPDSYNKGQIGYSQTLTREHTKIVRILPAIAHLQVVVLDNKSYEPVEEMPALLLGDIIDLLHVRANSEDTLPTGDRVGTDDRVLGNELLSDVLGSATRTRVDLEIVELGNFVEAGLRIGCSQALQELLVGLGDTIVYLVA